MGPVVGLKETSTPKEGGCKCGSGMDTTVLPVFPLWYHFGLKLEKSVVVFKHPTDDHNPSQNCSMGKRGRDQTQPPALKVK